MHCSSLSNINIQAFANITIENFKYCRSLVSVSFKEGLTHLNKEAFRYCSNLTSVEFPDSLQFLHGFTGANHSALAWHAFTFLGAKISYVKMPAAIKYGGIGQQTFYSSSVNEMTVEFTASSDDHVIIWETPFGSKMQTKANPFKLKFIGLHGRIAISNGLALWTKLELDNPTHIHESTYHPNNYLYNTDSKVVNQLLADFTGEFAADIANIQTNRVTGGKISTASFRFNDNITNWWTEYAVASSLFDFNVLRDLDFNNADGFHPAVFVGCENIEKVNFSGKKIFADNAKGLLYNKNKTRVSAYLSNSYYAANVDIEYPVETNVYPDTNIDVHRRIITHNGIWHTRWNWAKKIIYNNANEIAKLNLAYTGTYSFTENTFMRMWIANASNTVFEDKFKALFIDTNKDALWAPTGFFSFDSLSTLLGEEGENNGQFGATPLDFSWANHIKFHGNTVNFRNILFSNKLKYFSYYGDNDFNSSVKIPELTINSQNDVYLDKLGFINFARYTTFQITTPNLTINQATKKGNHNLTKLYLNTKLIDNSDTFFFDNENLRLIIADLKPGSQTGRISRASIDNLVVIRVNNDFPWQDKGVTPQNIIDATKLVMHDDVKYALTNTEAIIYDVNINKQDWRTIDIPTQIEGKPVTRVLDRAFNKIAIEKITFPATITDFGKELFLDSKVKKIIFNSPVANYDVNFITNTNELIAIDLPNGLVKFDIQTSDEYSYSKLEIIKANNTAKYRFKFNTIIDRATNEIVLGAKHSQIEFGILGIGARAFRHNIITTLTFPTSVKVIRLAAFAYSHLTGEIHLNEGLEVIEDYAFAELPNEVTLILPTTIKSIGTHAFQNANKLTLKFRGSMPTNQDFLTFYSGPTPEVNYQG